MRHATMHKGRYHRTDDITYEIASGQKALQREGKRAASHIALSRQAHASALNRGAASRSRAAHKAVRTKGKAGLKRATQKPPALEHAKVNEAFASPTGDATTSCDLTPA